MSEYMWAKIKIGGTISRQTLTKLTKKFDVPPPLSEETGAAASVYLVLEDSEAASGMFEGLENYLRKQAIPFDRASDGGYEHGPELRRFRPRAIDSDGVVSQPEVDRAFLCDHDSRPMVASADINAALAETQTREELVMRLVALCGSDIPSLTPLAVAEAAN